MNTTSIHKRRFRRDRWKNSLNDVLLWVVLFFFFIPALWIILTSVRIRSEINAYPPVWIPSGFSFDSYKILFGMPTPEGAFGLGGSIPVADYARNSILIALVSTIFALVFGTLAGYVFSRFRFKGKNGIFLGMMLARAIPGIALSLPLFVMYARTGLSDTVPGMIITYVALNIPFTAWLMDGFFRAIPKELDEAARTFRDALTGIQPHSASVLVHVGIVVGLVLVTPLAAEDRPDVLAVEIIEQGLPGTAGSGGVHVAPSSRLSVSQSESVPLRCSM